MNSNYFKKRVGGALIAFALLAGVAIVPTMTVQAQYGYGQDRRDRDYERDQRRRDREARRREREERRNDRDNRRYDNRDRDYNDGDWNNGRRGRNGNDDYANYGGSFQLRQTALNAGYNNGIEKGRKDRSRNDRYDFRDEGEYQKATKDYSSRMGDRELYRRYFRDAFARGYDAGYNGY